MKNYRRDIRLTCFFSACLLAARLWPVTGGSIATAPGVQDLSTANLAEGFNANAGPSGVFQLDSVALGISATAGDKSVALGQAALAQPDQGTAVGQSAWATVGLQSASIGSNAFAVHDGTSAIGSHAYAGPVSSSALGNGSNANANGGVAIGAGSQALGTGTAAIGFKSSSAAINALALGSFSSANANNSLALGTNSLVNASAANSVALGASSVATDPDTVSVGNAGTRYQRRIRNLAPGTAYSDAATVGQMADLGTQGQHFAVQQAQSAGAVVAAAAGAGAAVAGEHQNGKLALGFGALGGQGGLGLAYQYSAGQWSAAVSGASSGNADYNNVGGGVAFGW
jgi:hypothetical protein